MGKQARARTFWGDAQIAWALAFLLGVAWSVRGWSDLAALRLPDTDDVMRLQQVRDWIAGQPFADMSQHRIGIGLPMHWSRLGDLGPAALITLFAPLLGADAAEIVAVIAWPTMLFAAALVLCGRIARRVAGPGAAPTAIVVAAIAYPATTLFMPGRIDHHALQIVLALMIVRSLLARPRGGSGFAIALLSVASFATGMETAPFLAVAGAVLLIEWTRGESERMRGYAFGLLIGLGLARLTLAIAQWDFPACDGFTAIAWRAAMIGTALPVVLALLGARPRGPRGRALIAAVTGAAVLGAIVVLTPQCLAPYGGVDPMLARLWLRHVGEARPLLHAAPVVSIGYGGVLIAGILASAWRLARTRNPRWAVLLAFQLASLALALTALRGANLGAMLAAPALAAVSAAARARGPAWLTGAWLASAGMLYPLAADALVAAPARHGAKKPVVESCTSAKAMAVLAKLPRGRILAPVDIGAYALAETRHVVIAAPYHRNNAGNSAMYRFFLGTPDQAQKIARVWKVDYVVLCADSFDELGAGVTGDRSRVIGLLRAGDPPWWLSRLPTPRGGPMVFAPESLSEPSPRQ